MAMLGRFRRRMAAAGLSTLINSGALSPSVLDPKSIANLANLMIKVGASRRPAAGAPATLCGSHHGEFTQPPPAIHLIWVSVFFSLTLHIFIPTSPRPNTLQVVREIPDFKGDVAHLDGMDFAGELGSDYVLAARVNLSK
jgi:hypothetical protein